MRINELPAPVQNALLMALESVLHWQPSGNFIREFGSFKVAELNEYFDVAPYLA